MSARRAPERVEFPGSQGVPLAGRLQSKVLRVLVTGQVLGGVAFGATVSIGALLAAAVSGSNAWSGMAATMSTLGAALVAIPLARAAQARGRRVSLSAGSLLAAAGALLATVAAGTHSFPMLLVGLALAGAASATNLQARFAATDLALPTRRARDLSVVIWSTTIGAVLGPNLIEPGEAIGAMIGLPTLTGPFVFTIGTQLAAVAVYSFGLRPDPLLTALETRSTLVVARPKHGLAIFRTNPLARFAVVSVALSHTAMVALMSMTPIHLYDHGATLAIVGFTISLHIAGMYALSPVFGWLADKMGRIPVILFGQALLLAALVAAWVGSESVGMVTLSLILLGLGWSAAIIAASTLVAESVRVEERAGLQGFSDLVMNSSAAMGGALAGPVLTIIGYSGLGLVCMALMAVVVVWAISRQLRSRRTESIGGVSA